MTIRSGFLIVKSFERMYRDFREPSKADQAFYSIPRTGVSPARIVKQYRGIARDPLQAWWEELRDAPGIALPAEMDAARAIADLETQDKSDDDFIFTIDDARRVWNILKKPTDWELIWVRNCGEDVRHPMSSQELGYEPTWFTGDHFSAVADSMCFPRWHGCDDEGALFEAHHDALNGHGLFNEYERAQSFLDYYRSFDWTETGDYVIAEVRSVAPDSSSVGAG